MYWLLPGNMESLIILISGTVTGIVAGLFGVGGSFLLVPLLGIATSIPMEIIVGSCACQVLGPATAATLSYRPRLRDFRVPLTLLGGIVMGTLVGSDTLHSLHKSVAVNPQVIENAVQVGYIGVLLLVSLLQLLETIAWHSHRPLGIGWARCKWLPPTCEIFGRNRRHKVSLITLAAFGLGVGFLSGFLGLSGGIVLVPGLHYAFGVPTKRSVTMSMILVWLIAIQATCVHCLYERVDLQIVMLLLVGGTVGARVGAKISSKMAGPSLRRHFAWLTLGCALALILHQIWGSAG